MRENQRVGAIRVNRVSADLQEKGFEVFREDGLCSFDLVAHKNGILLRVEVKGHGSKIPRGSVVGCIETKSPHARIDCRKFDIMASVSEHPAQVRYLRSLTTQRNVTTGLLTGEEVQSNRTTFKVRAGQVRVVQNQNQNRTKRVLEGQNVWDMPKEAQ